MIELTNPDKFSEKIPPPPRFENQNIIFIFEYIIGSNEIQECQCIAIHLVRPYFFFVSCRKIPRRPALANPGSSHSQMLINVMESGRVNELEMKNKHGSTRIPRLRFLFP